jgi:peroxin-4
MAQFLKRVKKEADLYAASTDEFIQLRPSQRQRRRDGGNDDDDDEAPTTELKEWSAVIRGPPDTPFEDYLFTLAIELTSEYPLVPPTMRFVTKIFHPNVHFATGDICIDILKKEWSPAWSLQSACRAVMAILSEPVHDSPLNCDAGNMLRAGDLVAFRTMARMYCVEFATKLSSEQVAV